MHAAIVLAAAVFTVAMPAIATAQSGATPVFGKKILVKNAVPENESRNRVLVIAKDAAIQIPVPGTIYDPRCMAPGAPSGSVIVIGAGAANDPLWCENWTLIGSEASPRGYRYRDKVLDDSTVRTVVWKPGMFKILMSGRGPAPLFVDLTPGFSHDIEVTLFEAPNATNPNGYCVHCTPFEGRDGSDGKTFLGRDCPARGFCISSASGAFLDDVEF